MDPIARIEAVYEDTNSKFDIIMEYLVQIPHIQKKLSEHDERFEHLELRLNVIESIVKEHDKRFEDIDKRFDSLEEKFDHHTHEAIVLRAK